MKKAVLAFLAAVVAWTLIVSLLNRGLRVVLAGYAAAEPQLAFTLPMMAGRLTIAAITSFVSGAIIGAIAPAAAARRGFSRSCCSRSSCRCMCVCGIDSPCGTT